jgi:K+-transporting ATPase ATPase C chain
MLVHLRPALVLVALLTALTGIAYPLGVTGLAAAVFPHQAAGSPVTRDGVVVGSSLVGQSFSQPQYFWGRPSAAGEGYDGRASSGSNLGPTSQALADRVRAEAARHGVPVSRIPPELLTASGSGLDPHISRQAALFQVARVASARGLPVDDVQALVEARVEPRFAGVLGEEWVNILALNMALDAMPLANAAPGAGVP